MQPRKPSSTRTVKAAGKRTQPPERLLGAETFEAITELGNDGIFVFDNQLRIRYSNQMASEITGYSNAELMNMTVSRLLGQSFFPPPEDLFLHLERNRGRISTETEISTCAGEIKTVEIRMVLDPTSSETRKAYAYLRDITESEAMERRIREATGEFEKIAEMGDDGIVVFDQAFKIIFANQMASEITGIPKRNLIGRNFFTVIGKEDKEFLESTVTRGAGAGEKLCTEMTIVGPEGKLKDAEVCIASAKSNAGEMKTYAYIRDITGRKKFERDLKASEDKLRHFFERVRHGLFISSKEGKFLECNQALLEMLGYPEKETFLGIDITRDLYVHPDDRKSFQERIERDGYVKDMEVEFRKKNGAKITVLLTGYPVTNERGEIIAYEGINLDITERKRIEDELREANEFFKNLIESSVDGIIAADTKGHIFIFNKGAEALTGYRAEEVIGKLHITQIYPEGVAKEVMKELRGPEHGGVGKLTPRQFNVMNKFGEEVPIQLSATLIYDSAGNETASVGIFTDLRPRLKMERKLQETHLQLVNSEKMASLGKLAAGIAHEINNPLGGILIYSSLMMEDLPENDSRRQDLGRIVQEASRCKDIVKSLLEFAHQTEPQRELTDVNRAITDGLFFLENQALFHNIQIIKKLDPSLPLVKGSAGHLKQVFMNIIVNAAEAMHGSGVLTITTYPSPDANSIFIEFTDTGEGIPKENFTRIFEPFFTTKDVGKGTGLGLATSYGIVEDHGGKISVRSKVGQGATFTIELPASREIQPVLGAPPALERAEVTGEK